MPAQDDLWSLSDLGLDGAPPTEAANPASAGIDSRSAIEIVEAMHREDWCAFRAAGDARASLADLVDDVARAFERGGRLIYFGAGTSGRLGVLDASECVPTFGVGPERVQGFIAGGDRALRWPVEGAEDAFDDGVAAARGAGVGPQDVVCGIAASGSTPYVWGALAMARERHALTALVTCNPQWAQLAGAGSVDRAVVLAVGPEIIAGSTRLKAGTATKLALNTLTTAAMIRWGKVYDNLMVDLTPVNRKLRRRALGLVARIAAVPPERALAALRQAGGDVKSAVLLARGAASIQAARETLAAHQGRLREAMAALAPPPR